MLPVSNSMGMAAQIGIEGQSQDQLNVEHPEKMDVSPFFLHSV
jgi:hypothetical protein